jgi:predicted nucleotidyltransferase
MPMVTEDGLQDIVNIIRDIFPVRKILVFGSYARGDAHQHSDLNLCVVVAPTAEQPLEEWPSKSWLYRAARLTERIASAEVAVDPYVFTEGEFDALRDREHPLVGQILEEGRVVYEQ